jgi:hypothetical protein
MVEKMSTIEFSDIVSTVPHLNLQQLEVLEASVQVAKQIRTEGDLTGDSHFSENSDEGPSLNEQGQAILEDQENYQLSLGDQALLSALILGEGYQQDVFSSRDVNDIVVESGRSRITHVTSVVNGLLDKGLLSGSTKSLSLTKEGRAKARTQIGKLRRRAAAVA